MSSVAKFVLVVLTVWPTTLTPTIEKTRMYYKETTWNPDGMHLDSVLWRKAYIDGVEHIKCN